MSTGPRIPLAKALDIAATVMAILGPHCLKIDIAGSVRRQSPTIGDLEVVCLPDRDPLESTPLFAGGFAAAVEQWPGVVGNPDGRYTQRMLPCGLKLDLFMPHPDGYGLIMAIRTGSSDWAHKVLATRWKRAGAAARPGGADPITQGGPMIEPKPRTDDAQAVYEAVHKVWVTTDDPSFIAAAALRAAVDHIDLLIERCASPQEAEGRLAVLHAFLAIATELEGANV